MPFRPMLAETCTEHDVRFPVYASPKLDGLRGIVVDGMVKTRSMKPFTNVATHEFFSHPALEGLDGELIVGPPTAKDVFLRSTSALRNRVGDPGAVFYVFDLHNGSGTFEERLASLRGRVESLPEVFHGRVVVLDQWRMERLSDLLALEQAVLGQGYEGLILKHPKSPYKQGRSTLSQGWMLKLKRFADAEGELLGLVEGFRNDNAATTNELGYTERSTNAENMVGTDTTGAMVLKDLKSGAIFTVGTGFDLAQRAQWWDERDGDMVPLNTIIAGASPRLWMHTVKRPAIIKYKHFAIGYVGMPRFPVFVGERLPEDMS